MKNCIYAGCLDEKEFMASVEIFKGFLIAIAAVAFFSVFLIPEEEEFLRLGYGPITRYYLAAIALVVPLGIFVVRAIIKVLAWCRPCKKAGKPLCFCGTPLLIENNYRLEHFLFLAALSGLTAKCPCCGFSFPIERQ